MFLLMILPYLIPAGGKELTDEFQPFKESRFEEVSGIKLHYRLFEPEQEEIAGNLLFIHGFSGSTFSWRHNVEYFRQNGFKVVAVDLPAYGFSDKQKGFNHSPTSRAKLLWDFLNRLDGGKWNIAGHSMGAAVAVAMAAMQPEKTGSLILVNGAYFDPGRDAGRGVYGNLLMFPPVQRWGEVIANRRFFHYGKIEELLESAYGQKPDSNAVTGYLEPFLYKGTARAIINSFLNSQEIFTVKVEEIRSSTLIVWGENDSWVPPDAGKRIHQRLPQSEIIIFNNCGHCPMETHYTEFNQLLLNFLITGN